MIKARNLISHKIVAIKCIKREDAKPNELIAEVSLLKLLGDFHGSRPRTFVEGSHVQGL